MLPKTYPCLMSVPETGECYLIWGKKKKTAGVIKDLENGEIILCYAGEP